MTFDRDRALHLLTFLCGSGSGAVLSRLEAPLERPLGHCAKPKVRLPDLSDSMEIAAWADRCRRHERPRLPPATSE